jgi:hypothetical protein
MNDFSLTYSKVFIDAFSYELAPNVVTSEDLELKLVNLYESLHLQLVSWKPSPVFMNADSGTRDLKCIKVPPWPGKRFGNFQY